MIKTKKTTQKKSDVTEAVAPVKGYKVTDKNMQCRGYQFELGKKYEAKGEIVPCYNGFHYCQKLTNCFGYYTVTTENRVFEIIDHGTTKTEGDKSCTSVIEFVRELSWLEVLELVNTGSGNSGRDNAGNDNAGNDNAGYRNAGYSNAGNRNAGYSNAGNDNAGNYNAGNRNAGYSNAGNDNAGAFNNIQANYVMFNKPSNWTHEQFISSRAYSLLSSIDTTLWVPSSMMTEQEQKDHPYHVTTRGYIKYLPYKESFTNAWNNWSETSREAFTSLPNFEWSIFTSITGVEELNNA